VPLYEYECSACGRFEVIRKFSDPALSACPTCGRAVQKQFSAPAFQFKGTGWYVTDYARKSGGENAPDAPKAKDGPSEPAARKSEAGKETAPSTADSKPSTTSAK
jgi:putative FmdB family regulatory protein